MKRGAVCQSFMLIICTIIVVSIDFWLALRGTNTQLAHAMGQGTLRTDAELFHCKQKMGNLETSRPACVTFGVIKKR